MTNPVQIFRLSLSASESGDDFPAVWAVSKLPPSLRPLGAVAYLAGAVPDVVRAGRGCRWATASLCLSSAFWAVRGRPAGF